MGKFQSYLSFKIGDEAFAASVRQVNNIIELDSVTSVPNMPAYMLGVVNLRGNILPVIDARIKLNIPKRNENNPFIIVVEVNSEGSLSYLGVLVDEVLEVLEINEDQIQDSRGIQNMDEIILGFCTYDEKYLMILDIQKLLSTEELSIVDNFEKAM